MIHINSNKTFEVTSERLYQQLEEIEAICDMNCDEAKKLKRLIDHVDYDNTVYHLHVNPTLNCNFKCWYCYEEHNINSKMSPKIIDATLCFVKNIISNRNLKTFILSFFGGEPLMYFFEIADVLIKRIRMLCNQHNIIFKVHFTTNGYLLNDKIINSLCGINAAFQITLDGDRKHHDDVRFTSIGEGSYSTIVHNINLLATAQHEVLIRINYTLDNIESISHVVDDLSSIEPTTRTHITVDFQRVWQDRPILVEDRIISIIATYVESLNSKGYRCVYNSNIGPDHIRNSCYGDKWNHILVNYDGNLFFCTARDFKPETRVGYIIVGGEIIWEHDIYEAYFSSKFSKEACYACRIAPLCGGGCRQRAYESIRKEGCIYEYTQDDIDYIIKNRFNMRFLK
jgi:uncharacterized protein